MSKKRMLEHLRDSLLEELELRGAGGGMTDGPLDQPITPHPSPDPFKLIERYGDNLIKAYMREKTKLNLGEEDDEYKEVSDDGSESSV